MEDPGMMNSMKNAVMEMTGGMIPTDMIDNLEVMAGALMNFMNDPSNMDALMPFLEKVEVVAMDMEKTGVGRQFSSISWFSIPQFLFSYIQG